jgi:hypothetical protein
MVLVGLIALGAGLLLLAASRLRRPGSHLR